MSPRQSSRSPQDTLTLAQIQDLIRADPALPVHRRQDELSALNKVAQVLGVPLGTLPATGQLTRRLAEAAPQPHGIRPRRWDNIRALVHAAVARYAPPRSRRELQPLSPEWEAKARLVEDRFGRLRVSFAVHRLSEWGVPPGQETQAHFDAIRSHLQASLRKDPERQYRQLVRFWHRCVDSIPGFSSFRPARPPFRRKTWTLPWSSFPELQASKQAWLDRFDGSDPLAEVTLRERTIQSMDYMLREAASALALQGWEPAAFRQVADFGRLATFKAVLRFLLKQRNNRPGGHMLQIAWTLKGIATHVTGAPEDELKAMRATIARLEKKLREIQAPGLTRTNKDRLRPFDDPVLVRMLLQLPGRIARDAVALRAPRNGMPPPAGRLRRSAHLMALAVAIELLIMTSVRMDTLAKLEADADVLRVSRDLVWIAAPGRKVKNGHELDFPLPAPSVALLRLFLETFRPDLNERADGSLLPGRGGRFRSPGSLGQAIKAVIKKYTGLTVNPHLFRHLGAKLYLDANPGAYEVIRQQLGHRSVKTTQGFYTGLETAAAIRHYHATILGLRAEEKGA